GGDIVAVEKDRAGVGGDLAGDQVEQRGLGGAVWADDEPPFAGRNVECDVGGHAQAAEGLVEVLHAERGHGLRSPSLADGAGCGRWACRLAFQSRTVPGSRPSGMNVMMRTKMMPSTMFQRTM